MKQTIAVKQHAHVHVTKWACVNHRFVSSCRVSERRSSPVDPFQGTAGSCASKPRAVICHGTVIALDWAAVHRAPFISKWSRSPSIAASHCGPEGNDPLGLPPGYFLSSPASEAISRSPTLKYCCWDKDLHTRERASWPRGPTPGKRSQRVDVFCLWVTGRDILGPCSEEALKINTDFSFVVALNLGFLLWQSPWGALLGRVSYVVAAGDNLQRGKAGLTPNDFHSLTLITESQTNVFQALMESQRVPSYWSFWVKVVVLSPIYSQFEFECCI